MTRNTKFVSVKTAKIGFVVMQVILRSRPKNTLARCSTGPGNPMDFVHHGSRNSEEGCHLTVSRSVRPSIAWLAGHKKGPLLSRATPASARLVTLIELKFKAKGGHDHFIEPSALSKPVTLMKT